MPPARGRSITCLNNWIPERFAIIARVHNGVVHVHDVIVVDSAISGVHLYWPDKEPPEKGRLVSLGRNLSYLSMQTETVNLLSLGNSKLYTFGIL